jgi:hypothetical protein
MTRELEYSMSLDLLSFTSVNHVFIDDVHFQIHLRNRMFGAWMLFYYLSFWLLVNL